ncbi:hypothetical protein [Carboxylicivirga taeanensis]|uniref:hypothetical protein n=1 Tax=Carboxylicivirga taeanensis TaxID=1416875 RepID=UPI003F6E22B8
MKTSIPQSVIPESIDSPNALTTYYTTNVLYPKIGPLAVNRYVKLIARLLKDYAASVHLIELVKAYKEQFGKNVRVLEQPAAWLREELVFQPLLGSSDNYLNAFVVDLSAFRSPHTGSKADFRTGDKPAAGSAGSPNESIGTGRSIPVVRAHPVIITSTRLGNESIRAISDIKEGELELMNSRIVARPITREELTEANAAFSSLHTGEGLRLKAGEAQAIVKSQERAYKLGNILHGLSQVNAVMPDLIENEIIRTKGELVEASLFREADYLLKTAQKLAHQFQVTLNRLKEISRLIDQAFAYLLGLGAAEKGLFKLYKTNAAFKKQVQLYIIGKLDKAKIIDNALLPLPGESALAQSREWAFQRQEKLQLFIQKPVFRGPFSAVSVSPNSELTISETHFSSQFISSGQAQGTAVNQLTERGVFSSDRFRSELSNMTESGEMDENSFSSEATLLNTLRERRRETIDLTLTNISRENEERTLSAYEVGRNASKNYTTKGKDPDFATTELSFQVVTPVDVKVSLEAVNLVWAPHIPSPFISLHRIIRRRKQRAQLDYIQQNYVIDPVRPIEEYEEAIIEKELGIRGRHRYQTGTFDFPVGASYQTGGWELDLAASTVDFRNGTSDDYNWNEAWNWDDLENWDTHFQTLEQDGNRITGVAVLETTDPEYFNRGFFTFRFVMKRLTEASKAALRVYASDQAVAEAERRAVRSRARQYAKLKEDELIQQFEDRLKLEEEVFDVLIQRVFQGQDPNHFSYYKEVIRSCINWSEAAIHFESNDSPGLPFPEYSRSHFMNATGVRFILPILRNAEDNFVDSIRQNGSDYYSESVEKVRQLTEQYRQTLADLKAADSEKLILDQYTKDVVIGNHLEAVISNHPFTNQE